MSEIAERGHANYRAAVYGSVVVAALLGALRAEHADPRAKTIAVVSTTVVFWLAHVWAGVVGEQMHVARGWVWTHVRDHAREEWPLVQAGFLPVFPLLLAWVGVFSDRTGSRIAMALALGQLVAWGFIVGRRSHDSWPVALLSGVVTGSLGLVIVLLEVALH
jgi:hypothetical protein